LAFESKAFAFESEAFAFQSEAFAFESEAFAFQSDAFAFQSEAFAFESEAFAFQSEASVRPSGSLDPLVAALSCSRVRRQRQGRMGASTRTSRGRNRRGLAKAVP